MKYGSVWFLRLIYILLVLILVLGALLVSRVSAEEPVETHLVFVPIFFGSAPLIEPLPGEPPICPPSWMSLNTEWCAEPEPGAP